MDSFSFAKNEKRTGNTIIVGKGQMLVELSVAIGIPPAISQAARRQSYRFGCPLVGVDDQLL